MRSYLFTICCIIIYSFIIGLDYFNNWPSTKKEDILILISILTIFLTVNYALITRFLPFNLYKNYKNLIITPVIPSQCFLKELLNYFKTFQNLIFFAFTYFFFVYFVGVERFLINSFSFILYYVFFSYELIVLRFACGHSPKGRSAFFTVCLLINSLVMYQVLLVSKGVTNLFRMIIVEYNPFNTIFFLSVTNGENILFQIILYIIISIILYFFIKKLSWEKHLEFI